ITLVMSQPIHVFECKSEKKSIFKINPFNNVKLLLAVMVSLGALALAVMFPPLQAVFETVTLTSHQLLIALGFSVAIPIISAIFQ
ncbi:MAG: cation transporting ATPase C-terminal domain-containing protein, partial [Ruminococcus sp.]|nr:cation transporting ATPase C-terminal domain-containing protein [Ruminococcus sp.]